MARGALTPNGKRIGSIRIACRLLRALELGNAPLSLKDLSTRTEMSASKAHAYVATFVEEGLVMRDSAGKYSLGPFAMQLGVAAMRQSDIIAMAREECEKLHERLACSVFLSIWGNRGPTVIYKVDGRSLISTRIGHVLPILGSSSGQLFLAYLPRHETEAALEPELRADREKEREVETIIRRVRADGFSGMTAQGTYAGIAAPILRSDGRIIASLSISRPSESVDRAMRLELGKMVKEAALRVSAAMGFDATRLEALDHPVEERHWN